MTPGRGAEVCNSDIPEKQNLTFPPSPSPPQGSFRKLNDQKLLLALIREGRAPPFRGPNAPERGQ